MISRAVPLTEEQYLFIEDLGKEFLRAEQHETATKLLAIALAWKASPVVRFGCDIDESAGMATSSAPSSLSASSSAGAGEGNEPGGQGAEVVELHAYGKRVPCA